MSSLELQKAIVARLKADAGVTTLATGGVHDQPPSGVTFPYVSIGPDQVIPDRADCYDGSEVVLQVDVWSREVGFPEAKRIAEAVRAALTDAPLALAGHRLVDIAFVESRTLRDPDGLTSHAALTFRALTEPA